ncbi:hypothetical protein [Streptomyces shenzhenensis]|uniref:hypothetical protein n=1 Tax=Streptomyces shenzhenensis TaxID=943815 RepID=UPI0033D1B2CD
MDTFVTFLGVFAGGAYAVALYLNSRQRNITAHLVDGRRIKILCVLKDPRAPRWTRGHFVIESGAWTWEPSARQDRPLMLPLDAQPVRIRPPAPGERRLNHRFFVMECASDEGDVLVAAPHGQVEHVFMALTRG